MAGRDVWGTYLTDDDFQQAAKMGICKSTLKSRLANGWKAKKAISEPVKFKNRTDPEYQKYKRAAISNGINSNTFKRRVLRGWLLEMAANTPLIEAKESTRRAREIRKQVIPKELVKLAAKNDICYSTLYYRIMCAKSICTKEVATKPPMSKREQGLILSKIFHKR